MHDVVKASPTREILRNRMMVLDKVVEKGFLRIGSIVPSMDVFQRKALCQWLQDLPQDPGRKYTIKQMLSLLGVPRASYYAALKSEYCQAATERILQDEQDAALIRQVMDYKGFAKGSRQIYMMLPSLTGKHLGLKKIRRIMKQFGITSSIRKSKKPMGGAVLRENIKPNLLRRRFRLHRPNEVRLTDVTYLDYGDKRRVYGSALLDPVTGVLVAFLVSEHNNVALALETLRQADTHPCPNGGIYHSDQGVVYLSATFQQEVSSRGFEQSMSKRGNCHLATPVERAGIVDRAADIHADNQGLFRHLRNLRILCIIHMEPPFCLGCYILQDAPQAYREAPLFSIGVFYGLQECSNMWMLIVSALQSEGSTKMGAMTERSVHMNVWPMLVNELESSGSINVAGFFEHHTSVEIYPYEEEENA